MSNTQFATAQNKSEKLFQEGYSCSQSILLAYAERFNLNPETAKAIASTFGGGMGRLRKTCGALTGAYMVLGLKFGNLAPDDMDRKLHSYSKVRELTRRFKAIHGETDCGPLIKRLTSPEGIKQRQHHHLICSELVRSVHELLGEMLEDDRPTA